MTSSQPPLAVHRRAEFRTTRVRLRPAREEDQELMFGWRSDAATARYLSGAAPESMQQQRQWYDGVRGDSAYSYHIVENDGVPVGFTSMFNAEPTQRDAEWGLVIGGERTPGDVRIIAPLCCYCAFRFAELETIFVCINEDNAGAIRRVEQLSAMRFDAPSAYNKEGEMLMSIHADKFKARLSSLIEGNPALTEILDAEMIVEEPAP